MSNSLREAVQQVLEALNKNDVIWPQGTIHHKLAQILAQATAPQPPAEQDDGPLTAAQIAAIKQQVPQGAKKVVRSSLDNSKPAGQGAELSDYPPLPEPLERFVWSDDTGQWHRATKHYYEMARTQKYELFTSNQMRAYVDADREARGGAA